MNPGAVGLPLQWLARVGEVVSSSNSDLQIIGVCAIESTNNARCGQRLGGSALLGGGESGGDLDTPTMVDFSRQQGSHSV